MLYIVYCYVRLHDTQSDSYTYVNPGEPILLIDTHYLVDGGIMYTLLTHDGQLIRDTWDFDEHLTVYLLPCLYARSFL